MPMSLPLLFCNVVSRAFGALHRFEKMKIGAMQGVYYLYTHTQPVPRRPLTLRGQRWRQLAHRASPKPMLV